MCQGQLEHRHFTACSRQSEAPLCTWELRLNAVCVLCSAQLPRRGHAAASEPRAASSGRASEVDRKLHLLTSEQGRLQEPFRENIVRMLRLFNLCDFSSDLSSRAPKVPCPAMPYQSPSSAAQHAV